MKKMSQGVFAAITAMSLMIFPLTSRAGESPNIMIFGSGLDSCGKWLDNHPINAGSAYIQDEWVEGFLAATSIWEGRNLLGDEKDPDGIFYWITNYCKQHPTRQILDATVEFAGTMNRQLEK